MVEYAVWAAMLTRNSDILDDGMLLFYNAVYLWNTTSVQRKELLVPSQGEGLYVRFHRTRKTKSSSNGLFATMTFNEKPLGSRMVLVWFKIRCNSQNLLMVPFSPQHPTQISSCEPL